MPDPADARDFIQAVLPTFHISSWDDTVTRDSVATDLAPAGTTMADWSRL
jgi:hypothetical protein